MNPVNLASRAKELSKLKVKPSIAYIDDSSAVGVQVGDPDGELYAWVDVPLGYTATKVRVYGSDTANDVVVTTWDITDGTIGSEISNAALDVGDDLALASNHVGSDTNMLLIQVVVILMLIIFI